MKFHILFRHFWSLDQKLWKMYEDQLFWLKSLGFTKADIYVTYSDFNIPV